MKSAAEQTLTYQKSGQMDALLQKEIDPSVLKYTLVCRLCSAGCPVQKTFGVRRSRQLMIWKIFQRRCVLCTKQWEPMMKRYWPKAAASKHSFCV